MHKDKTGGWSLFYDYFKNNSLNQFQQQSFQWIFRVDFQDWLVWSPCNPRDSQEPCPASQFESINSSALSLPYGPTLTSVHDYWKNHSFDYTDLCGKVTSLLFNMLSRFVITFLPMSKLLNFMAVVTICSDLGAQENKYHFHFFPIYLPWSDGTIG